MIFVNPILRHAIGIFIVFTMVTSSSMGIVNSNLSGGDSNLDLGENMAQPDLDGAIYVALDAIAIESGNVVLRYNWSHPFQVANQHLTLHAMVGDEVRPVVLTDSNAQSAGNGTVELETVSNQVINAYLQYTVYSRHGVFVETASEVFGVFDGELVTGTDVPEPSMDQIRDTALDVLASVGDLTIPLSSSQQSWSPQSSAPLVANPAQGSPPVSSSGHDLCTDDLIITAQYKVSDGTSHVRPDKWGAELPYIEVELFDSEDNSYGQVKTTNKTGNVTFTIPALNLDDECGIEAYFERALRWADGQDKKIWMSNLGGSMYRAQSNELSFDYTHNEASVTMDKTHEGAGYMLGQAVQSYLFTKSEGEFSVPASVEVLWTDNKDRPGQLCSTCYNSNTNNIFISGEENREWNDRSIFHEYGHHVHAQAGTPAWAGFDSHNWDTVFDTPGQAFNEGWANYFAAAVREDPNLEGFPSLENPNRPWAGNGNCYGPYRECSVAAVLWNVTATGGAEFSAVIDTLKSMEGWPEIGARGIHELVRKWQDPSSLENLHNAAASFHIPAEGDLESWIDAGSKKSTAIEISSNV